MQRRGFLAAAACSVGVVAGCLGRSNRSLPDVPTGEWRQHGSDSLNTGAGDVDVPERGEPAWDEGDTRFAEPLVSDGVVYAVANSVTALDAQTGEQRWERDLQGSADGTPAITDEQLIVATEHQIVAFSCDDGSEQWSSSLPLAADGAVTADRSLVTVPLEARPDEAGLVAYDSADGERLWTHPTLAAKTTAIDGDRVYSTGYRQDADTGILRALSATDGSLLWEVELEHPDTSPVVADGELLVGENGVLAVHDIDDGERLRTLGTFGDRLYEPPAVADGVAFVGSDEPAIVAVSTEDGATEWTSDGGAGARISVGREAIVVSAESLPESNRAGVAVLERSTGDLRWEHELDGFDVYPSSAPALADGAVFFISIESSGVVALGDL